MNNQRKTKIKHKFKPSSNRTIYKGFMKIKIEVFPPKKTKGIKVKLKNVAPTYVLQDEELRRNKKMKRDKDKEERAYPTS